MLDLAILLEELDDRQIRRVRSIRHTAGDERSPWVRSQCTRKLVDEPRLADAGLTHHLYESAMTLLDLREAIPEDLQLLLAPDEAAQGATTEAKSSLFTTRDPIWPRPRALGLASRDELESSLEERHGGFAGDDGLRLSQRDQHPQWLAGGRHRVEIDARMIVEPGDQRFCYVDSELQLGAGAVDGAVACHGVLNGHGCQDGAARSILHWPKAERGHGRPRTKLLNSPAEGPNLFDEQLDLAARVEHDVRRRLDVCAQQGHVAMLPL